jgi:nitrate/nitrite-specific signal transduction histidine kinase
MRFFVFLRRTGGCFGVYTVANCAIDVLQIRRQPSARAVQAVPAKVDAGVEPGIAAEISAVAPQAARLVRDEIYRIAIEALRNAFRHSQARRIEVEIQYDRRRLRMRIWDDGKGIDPKILGEGGRKGHHGLAGMQERAKLAGGKLAVWSRINGGTEMELTIPGAIAYGKSSAVRATVGMGKRT